jgi:hypothetical protein
VLRVDRDEKNVLRKTPSRAVPAAGEVAGHGLLFATIEPMHGNVLAAHYPDGNRRVLTDRMVEGHALKMDSLLTGPIIVAGWRGKGGGLSAFTPAGTAPDRTGKIVRIDQWRETVIDDGGMACEDLALADLDSDGRLDIIASGRATKNVKIYWNKTEE